MAVMIPEAAGAAESGAAAGAARLSGRRPPGRHRAPAKRPGPATRPAAYSPAKGQPRVAPRGRPQNPRSRDDAFADEVIRQSREGGQPQVAPERANGNGLDRRAAGQMTGAARRLSAGTYHRIVIAEFVATMAIIAVSGFLVPRDKNSGSPSAEAEAITATISLTRPLVRLTAACLLFFLLALMANGQRAGRVAAAGGALVMLGALLNAGPAVKAIGQMFAGAQQPVTPSNLGAQVAQTAANAVGGATST